MAAHKPPSDSPPGVNIWRRRIELGLSMRALGERCEPEIDHTTVRRLERNEGFTQDTLERIARALGCNANDLFLPPELADWPVLSKSAKTRIAETVRDAATAQRYKTTG